jgi:hypothetical protein
MRGAGSVHVADGTITCIIGLNNDETLQGSHHERGRAGRAACKEDERRHHLMIDPGSCRRPAVVNRYEKV